MINKMAYFREKLGMSQEELANKVGVDVAAIKTAEKSDYPKNLPAKCISDIADALGIIDIRDLFMQEETESKNCASCEATEKLDEIACDLSGILATFKIVLEAMEREAEDYSKLTNDSHIKGRASQYTESLWHLVGQLDTMYNGI